MKENVRIANDQLINAIQRVDWSDKKTYAQFMAQTYFYVCHSTRLLARAASYLALHEQVAFNRFVSHLDEENNHERLAIHDIRSLGFDISEFFELRPTSLMYQTQYFYIENRSPWSLLGYILLLETLATQAGPVLRDRVSSHHGSKATSFLRVHAEEDPTHVQQAMQLIEQLNQNHRADVVISFDMTQYCYNLMLEELTNLKSK